MTIEVHMRALSAALQPKPEETREERIDRAVEGYIAGLAQCGAMVIKSKTPEPAQDSVMVRRGRALLKRAVAAGADESEMIEIAERCEAKVCGPELAERIVAGIQPGGGKNG